MTNKYIDEEVAIEVAWQLEKQFQNIPRADARHIICQIAEEIVAECVVNSDTEDIDEVINQYLIERGYIK